MKFRKALTAIGIWSTLLLAFAYFIIGFAWLDDRISLAIAIAFGALSLGIRSYGKIRDLEDRTQSAPTGKNSAR